MLLSQCKSSDLWIVEIKSLNMDKGDQLSGILH